MDIFGFRDRFNEVGHANELRIGEIHRSHGLNAELPSTNRFHHYTDTKGLFGILKDGAIWANNIEYMNDSKELTYGLELASELILREGNQQEGNANSAVRVMLLRMNYALSKHQNERTYYVSCFCEEGDLLSQWRGYGNNSGFSLDFSASEIEIAASETTAKALNEGWDLSRRSGPYMEKVIYNRTKQEALLTEVINSCVQCYRELMGDCDFWEIEMRHPQDKDFIDLFDNFGIYAAHHALRFVTQFKHPAFAEEKEWRMVHRRCPDEFDGIEFRSGQGWVIPYTKIPLDLGRCLESITCGPPFNPLAMKSIETFLKAKKLDKPVKQASAPLR